MKKFDVAADKVLNGILIALLSVGIYMCGFVNGQMTASDEIEVIREVEYVYISESKVNAVPELPISEAVEPVESTNENSVEYFDVPLEESIQDHIFAVCEESNIDPKLIFAMVKKESGFNIDAIGDNGMAFGLMQIWPKWHHTRMDILGCPDLLDPYQNITVGVDYMEELLNLGRGVEWALMAYNGGPNYANEKRAAGIVSDYARVVLSYVEELEVAE